MVDWGRSPICGDEGDEKTDVSLLALSYGKQL
jgi:hypothetical protein